MLQNKEMRLWTILSGIFISSAMVAEFIGVKLFSLEASLGMQPANLAFLGQEGLSFTLTAGVLLWPIVFILTDLLNEYYGPKGVRLLSWLTASLIAIGFVVVTFAIRLTPAQFWRTAHLKASLTEAEKVRMMAEVGDYNTAFSVVFGQSLWIIVGSIFAFIIAQLVDVAIFHKIKQHTHEKQIWLRATGSTLISQFLDSFVVVFIALYIGQQLPFLLVLAIAIMSYIYKCLMALLLTPVLYGVHAWIDSYLGSTLATKLKQEAMS